MLDILNDDYGAMHMVNIARLNGQVHLFVVHKMCEPEIIEMSEYNGHDWHVGEVGGGGDKGELFEVGELDVAAGEDGECAP